MTRTLMVVIALSLVLALSGCESVGPKTIPADRFAYSSAISTSFKEQALLNLVRLRYGEIPVFLELTSIINQYTLGGGASVGGTFIPGDSNDTFSVGGSGSWSDRPTISYMPVTGKKLAERLMRPIEPISILALIQAGWPVEFIFPLAVRSVNGIRGPSGTRVDRGHPDEEYFRLVELMSRAQRSSHIGARLEQRKGAEASILLLTNEARASEEDAECLREIRRILGLDDKAGNYELVFGTVPKSNQEIALHTRSGLEIMIELCSWIDVPEEHIAAKRTTPTRRELDVGGFRLSAPIRIHSGDSVPDNALTGVRFRDTWFWIRDDDFNSKRAFAFLMLMSLLVESETRQFAPIVTVGAGG